MMKGMLKTRRLLLQAALAAGRGALDAPALAHGLELKMGHEGDP